MNSHYDPKYIAPIGSWICMTKLSWDPGFFLSIFSWRSRIQLWTGALRCQPNLLEPSRKSLFCYHEALELILVLSSNWWKNIMTKLFMLHVCEFFYFLIFMCLFVYLLISWCFLCICVLVLFLLLSLFSCCKWILKVEGGGRGEECTLQNIYPCKHIIFTNESWVGWTERRSGELGPLLREADIH